MGLSSMFASTGPWPVAEAADVLVALRAHRALRLVGGVVGHLGEDRLVEVLDLAPHHRQQRAALQPRRRRRCRSGRRSSGTGRRGRRARRRRFPPCEAARAAHDQSTPMPRSYSVALAPGKASPWSVVRITSVSSARSCSRARPARSDALVERARAGLVGRHVAARLGRVGQVVRWQRVQRVAHRGRLEVLAVRLEEARPRGRTAPAARCAISAHAPPAPRSRRDCCRPRPRGRSRGRPGRLREVLLADQPGPVAGLAERVHDVVLVVGEPLAAVGEAQHPVGAGSGR